MIEAGLFYSDSLTILVCDHPRYQIPATLRAAWLQEMHPTAEIRVIEDIGYDDDSEVWASYTKHLLGWTPDIVFTSEDYGDGYAEVLGCRHIQVDKARLAVPISGTQIREDPYKWWDFIGSPVRAFFARRICVIGAESTGKTTLVRALAAHYRTAWVPEFARTYSDGKCISPDYAKWDTREFLFIAKTQSRFETELARQSNKLLICDTNSLVTELWHERYLGFRSPELATLSHPERYDLYLLTGDEIPFQQDAIRDGEQIRHSMHLRFVEEFRSLTVPGLVLEGPHEQRLQEAIKACDELLRSAPALRERSLVFGKA